MGLLLAYAGPAAGHGYMFLLTGIYLMAFATDVLLVPPATLALLFGLSRIWDAVSDPLAGYLTDRTRTRFGRRRPWMLAGAIPMALAFAMLWAPPQALEGGALVAWVGVALLVFYTASTAVDVPHSALGAEICEDYHERNRLFGYKRALFGVGSLLAVASMQGFLAGDAREVGRWVGPLAGALALVLVLLTVLRVRERPEYQGRGARTPLSAVRDVWRNRHARVLLGVFTLQQLGVVGVSVTIPYYSKYVLETPEYTSAFLGCMFVSALLGVPFWMRFSQGRDKRRVIVRAMVVVALALAALSLAPKGAAYWVMAIATLAGFAAAALDVLLPSAQADVIDVDERDTGERKEGAYFAAWAFAAKTAGGVAAMIVGFALDGLGFEPNATQSAEVLLGLRAVAGLLPALVYTAGLLLFLRFSLGPDEHRGVREDIAQSRELAAADRA